MSSASDKELSALHKKLSESMIKALDSASSAEYLITKYEGSLPNDVTDYLERQTDISPSLMTAVAKFLKDNDITAAKDDSAEIGELEMRLAAKQDRKRVGNVVPIVE
jgi:hypothetical protein